MSLQFDEPPGAEPVDQEPATHGFARADGPGSHLEHLGDLGGRLDLLPKEIVVQDGVDVGRLPERSGRLCPQVVDRCEQRGRFPEVLPGERADEFLVEMVGLWTN